MAKGSGLGDAFFLHGYDISGDIGSISTSGGPALLDVTGINKSAFERIGGVRTGGMSWSAYFNPSDGRAHDRLENLPTTDVHCAYFRGTTLGNPAACMVAKQLNYDGTRAADGAFTFEVEAQSNGYGLEWGRSLTAGIRTDTGATTGTGVAYNGGGGSAYVLLPGTSGNTVTTPDAASLDITGDIDVRCKFAADDWTPAAAGYFMAKWTTTGNQRSWSFGLTTAGALTLLWSPDGASGTVLQDTSTANLSALSNGATKWVRVTLDVDNGASGHTTTFYTSDDGTTWTQLGTAVTTAATTSIFSSSAILEIGSRDAGTTSHLAGKFFEGIVMQGIAGTERAHPVATVSGVTDATPLTWTVNGTAIPTIRTSYGLQAYLQVLSFTGTDATIKLQESADNGVNDAWADVTGGAFTQVTSGPTAERIATSSTLDVERYLRVTTTTSGGFTGLSFVVVVARNDTATTF